MDVPFLSSTAINRDHYHLVRSVEAANTIEQIDTILVHKVEFLRKRFAQKKSLSLSGCSYALVILLYCWLNTSMGNVRRELLEFALPQAINLAEAGTTIQQKRIGYTFCFLIMDESHELQLMLVNTLRKDIESSEIPRISLALDALIMKCPIDALPAVVPRLIDLLAHYSSLVRSKSLMLMRNIAKDDPQLWTLLSQQLSQRLSDPDTYVIVITMRIMQDLLLMDNMKPSEVAYLILQNADVIMQKDVKLRFVKLSGFLIPLLLNDERDSAMKLLDIIFDIIDIAHSQRALLLECFRLFSRIPSEVLSPYFKSRKNHPLRSVVESIDSSDPNAVYFCLACLEHVDPKFWTGNIEGYPASFTEAQVNTIMSFLQCPDQNLRFKVLRTLKMVDQNILLEYLTQLISNPVQNTPYQIEMALEVASIYEEEGQGYAIWLKDICSRAPPSSLSLSRVHERKLNNLGISREIIEAVLLHLRTVSEMFRGHFVDEMLKIPPSQGGSTLTLIVAATMYEYGHLSSLPTAEKLKKLVDFLENKPAAVQESLLLTILRVTASEETVPPYVTERIHELHQLSKSLIKKRCAQFLTFSNDLSRLRDIISAHKCDTLPEFSGALDIVGKYGQLEAPQTTGPYRDHSQVSAAVAKGRLRYEPYETPQLPSKHNRPREVSRNPSFETSSSSKGTPSTLTLSPGQLALAVYELDLSKTEPEPDRQGRIEEETRDDLIALDLDSPFLVDAMISAEGVLSPTADTDFDYIWQTLSSCPSVRGWSEREIDQIVAAFYTNYKSQYNIKDFHSNKGKDLLLLPLTLTTSPEVLAALRLRPGEEGTTLWQIRCPNTNLRTELKVEFS